MPWKPQGMGTHVQDLMLNIEFLSCVKDTKSHQTLPRALGSSCSLTCCLRKTLKAVPTGES